MLVLRSLAFNANGQAYSAGHLNGSFALARFNQDGSFDQTFGSSGIVSGLGGTDADAIYVLKNGDILLTGYQAGMPVAVSRYAKDGSLINTFGNKGFKFFDFYQHNVGQSIHELNNGNLIVCAITNNSSYFFDYSTGSTGVGVALLDSNGDFINTFGNNDGKIILESKALPWYTQTNTQKFDSEQKILVSGTIIEGSQTDIFVSRLNLDGTADQTFGINGTKKISIENSNEMATKLLVNSNNQIFITGVSSDGKGFFDNSQFGSDYEYGSKGDFFIAALNADGSINTNYGKNGLVFTDFGQREIGCSAAFQGNKIIMAGQTAPGIWSDFQTDKLIISRYTAVGALDKTFGSKGFTAISLSFPVGAVIFRVTDVQVDKDNNIYALCTTGVTSSTVKFDANGLLLSSKAIGTDVSDCFGGTEKSDLLLGLDGNDSLNGGAGNDVMLGGRGDDVINGDLGNNTASYSDTSNDVVVNLFTGISIGEGSDTLINIQNSVGGTGSDQITGNDAANILTGGSGNDELIGLLGNDTLDGGVGFDCADYQLSQSNLIINLATGKASGRDIGSDKLIGIEEACAGAGNDSLIAASGGSQLEGNAGNDLLTGGDSADVLYGGNDNDKLIAGAGLDFLDGGEGNDILKGGLDSDNLDGGSGNDTADYSDKTTSIVAALDGSNTTIVIVNGSNEDSIKNIENLTGGSYNDSLTGDDNANVLIGGAGNDRLIGGVGNDVLTGGTGADLFLLGSELNQKSNLDKITDFNRSDGDKLILDIAIFTKLTAGFSVSNLVVNTTGKAADNNDFLIFNSKNNTLFYDADGSDSFSNAVAITKLTGIKTLSISDFDVMN